MINTLEVRNQLKQYIDQVSAQDFKIVGEIREQLKSILYQQKTPLWL